MTPLEIIKYIVEHLEGTAFEPWVNSLLFLLFTVAVMVAIRLLIGRKNIDRLLLATLHAFRNINNSMQYSPEVEAVSARLSPYIELVGNLYVALVGLCSTIIVGLLYIFSPKENVVWYGHVVVIVWVMASFSYTRLCLAQASWSYHKIRNRR